MKRDPSLRPLSREHLGALLVARKLRDPATEPGAAREAFLEFWRSDGRRHFRIEEELVLPAWALAAEIDRDGARRMLDEHLAIRAAALRLERAGGAVSADELRELGDLLHDHVRFEERQLFPAVEDALDPEELARLGAAIEAAESGGASLW